jgi:hypothetical protein
MQWIMHCCALQEPPAPVVLMLVPLDCVPVDWVPVDCVPVLCVPVDCVPELCVPVDWVPVVAKVPLVAFDDDVVRCTPPVPGPLPPAPPKPPEPEIVSDVPAQPSRPSTQTRGAAIRVIRCSDSGHPSPWRTFALALRWMPPATCYAIVSDMSPVPR